MSEPAFFMNLGLCISSLTLLGFLAVAAVGQEAEAEASARGKQCFLAVVLLTALLILTDAVSRCGAGTGVSVFWYRASNFLLFFFNPLLSVLWFTYVCEKAGINRGSAVGIRAAQWAAMGFNAVFTLATPFTGWLYSFDASGEYRRGPLFWVTSLTILCIAVLTEVCLALHREYLERQQFWALMLFPLIPLVGSAVQVRFYGIAWGLDSTAFALLIVFVYVQNRNMDIDYLTGLSNRRKLDSRMKKEIAFSGPGRTFSAILLDLDHFKDINDRFGHSRGDEALQEAASLLRQSLRADAFIARYGGDEFCVILNNGEEKTLERVMHRIARNVEDFNAGQKRPYRIRFSMGGCVYDPSSRMGVREFQALIDGQMYSDKRAPSGESGG